MGDIVSEVTKPEIKDEQTVDGNSCRPDSENGSDKSPIVEVVTKSDGIDDTSTESYINKVDTAKPIEVNSQSTDTPLNSTVDSKSLATDANNDLNSISTAPLEVAQSETNVTTQQQQHQQQESIGDEENQSSESTLSSTVADSSNIATVNSTLSNQSFVCDANSDGNNEIKHEMVNSPTANSSNVNANIEQTQVKVVESNAPDTSVVNSLNDVKLETASLESIRNQKSGESFPTNPCTDEIEKTSDGIKVCEKPSGDERIDRIENGNNQTNEGSEIKKNFMPIEKPQSDTTNTTEVTRTSETEKETNKTVEQSTTVSLSSTIQLSPALPNSSQLNDVNSNDESISSEQTTIPPPNDSNKLSIDTVCATKTDCDISRNTNVDSNTDVQKRQLEKIINENVTPTVTKQSSTILECGIINREESIDSKKSIGCSSDLDKNIKPMCIDPSLDENGDSESFEVTTLMGSIEKTIEHCLKNKSMKDVKFSFKDFQYDNCSTMASNQKNYLNELNKYNETNKSEVSATKLDYVVNKPQLSMYSGSNSSGTTIVNRLTGLSTTTGTTTSSVQSSKPDDGTLKRSVNSIIAERKAVDRDECDNVLSLNVQKDFINTGLTKPINMINDKGGGLNCEQSIKNVKSVSSSIESCDNSRSSSQSSTMPCPVVTTSSSSETNLKYSDGMTVADGRPLNAEHNVIVNPNSVGVPNEIGGTERTESRPTAAYASVVKSIEIENRKQEPIATPPPHANKYSMDGELSYKKAMIEDYNKLPNNMKMPTVNSGNRSHVPYHQSSGGSYENLRPYAKNYFAHENFKREQTVDQKSTATKDLRVKSPSTTPPQHTDSMNLSKRDTNSNSLRDLSLLHTKNPDFGGLSTKVYSADLRVSHPDFSKTYEHFNDRPSGPQKVDATNFAEVRKKYNYISDLQLKTSEPVMKSQQTVGLPTHNSLYVKGPDLNPEKILNKFTATNEHERRNQLEPPKVLPTLAFPQLSQDVTMSIVDKKSQKPANEHQSSPADHHPKQSSNMVPLPGKHQHDYKYAGLPRAAPPTMPGPSVIVNEPKGRPPTQQQVMNSHPPSMDSHQAAYNAHMRAIDEQNRINHEHFVNSQHRPPTDYYNKRGSPTDMAYYQPYQQMQKPLHPSDPRNYQNNQDPYGRPSFPMYPSGVSGYDPRGPPPTGQQKPHSYGGNKHNDVPQPMNPPSNWHSGVGRVSQSPIPLQQQQQQQQRMSQSPHGSSPSPIRMSPNNSMNYPPSAYPQKPMTEVRHSSYNNNSMAMGMPTAPPDSMAMHHKPSTSPAPMKHLPPGHPYGGPQGRYHPYPQMHHMDERYQQPKMNQMHEQAQPVVTHQSREKRATHTESQSSSQKQSNPAPQSKGIDKSHYIHNTIVDPLLYRKVSEEDLNLEIIKRTLKLPQSKLPTTALSTVRQQEELPTRYHQHQAPPTNYGRAPPGPSNRNEEYRIPPKDLPLPYHQPVNPYEAQRKNATEVRPNVPPQSIVSQPEMDARRNQQVPESVRSSTVHMPREQPPHQQIVDHRKQMAMQSNVPQPQQPSSSNAVPIEMKRESPLDLSVKTVKTKADSTGCENYGGTAMRNRDGTLKINFTPNFSKHSLEGRTVGLVQPVEPRPNHIQNSSMPVNRGSMPIEKRIYDPSERQLTHSMDPTIKKSYNEYNGQYENQSNDRGTESPYYHKLQLSGGGDRLTSGSINRPLIQSNEPTVAPLHGRVEPVPVVARNTSCIQYVPNQSSKPDVINNSSVIKEHHRTDMYPSSASATQYYGPPKDISGHDAVNKIQTTIPSPSPTINMHPKKRPIEMTEMPEKIIRLEQNPSVDLYRGQGFHPNYRIDEHQKTLKENHHFLSNDRLHPIKDYKEQRYGSESSLIYAQQSIQNSPQSLDKLPFVEHKPHIPYSSPSSPHSFQTAKGHSSMMIPTSEARPIPFNSEQYKLPPNIRGADQGVISKLRNSLELKEMEKQKMLKSQSSTETHDEETGKSDIASIIAARIRTKGELKKYTPLPVEQNSILDAPKIATHQGNNGESTSGFNLLDWGNACNGFVEQLQTGTVKKPQSSSGRGRRKKDSNSTKGDKQKSSSSDENTPLVMLRQQSLSQNARQGNSTMSDKSFSRTNSAIEFDTKTSAKDTEKEIFESDTSRHMRVDRDMMVEKLTEKCARNLKEKQRIKQASRLAARLSKTSSSESEPDTKRIKVKRAKKFIRKPRSLVSLDQVRTGSNGDDTEEDDEFRTSWKSRFPSNKRKLNEETTDSDAPIKKQITPRKHPSSSDSDSDINESVTGSKNLSVKFTPDKGGTVSSQGQSSKKPDGGTTNTSNSRTKENQSGSNNSTKMNSIPKNGDSNPSDSDSGDDDNESGGDKKSSRLARLRGMKTPTKNERKNGVVQPETMTRSKLKREQEAKLANSKVLRNDKVIHNVPLVRKQHDRKLITSSGGKKNDDNTPPKSGSKQNKIDSANKNDMKKSTNRLKVTKNRLESSSSTSSEEEDQGNRVDRLRPRKSKADETDRKPSMDKKPVKNLNGKKLLPVKSASCTKSSNPFPPGWEQEMYHFKRSLKIPPELISVRRQIAADYGLVDKSNPRISSSLPDLDPHSSDTSETVNSDRNQKFAAGEQYISKKTSIIDLLHQRVLNNEMNTSPFKIKTEKPKILPQTNEVRELPIPQKDLSSEEGGKLFESIVLKSRTRTEMKVNKQKEIIRQVFGCDDRPASAPPFGNNEDSNDFAHKLEELNATTTNEILSMKIKMNNETPMNRTDDNESRDTELIGCAVNSPLPVIKNEEFNDRDTPSILSEKCFTVVKSKRGRGGRRKGSSGFDYLRKKKRPLANQQLPARRQVAAVNLLTEKDISDIQKEIRGWVLNRGVGETVLHKATRLNCLDVIAYCLEMQGMDPDLKDNAGYTALHVACTKGRMDIARLLLQYGAKHTETAISGIRPLHEAAENGDIEIVRLLLSYGADPLLTTYSGQTPYMLAEDDDDMRDFLRNHLLDIEPTVKEKATAWRFEGPWKVYDEDEFGFNIFSDVPEPEELPFVEQSIMPLKRPKTPPDEKPIKRRKSRNQSIKLPSPDPENLENMLVIEESTFPLPTVYQLDNDGNDKWVLLTDLCNIVGVKSKDTLLKQISSLSEPSIDTKDLCRELKLSEFLEKAKCLQLLCAGEKLNIRSSSKVVLVRYNEIVKKHLLGIESFTVEI